MALTRQDSRMSSYQRADADPRSVSDKLSDVVSVYDFGAVGDGVTDDTAAFQAALADVTTTEESNPAGCPAGHRSSIYVPDGVYRITSNLTAASFYGSLVGDGIETSVLLFDGCDGLEIDNRAASGQHGRPVLIEGLTFAAASSGARTALYLKSSASVLLGKQFTVKGCQFRGRQTGGGHTDCWQRGIVFDQAHYSDVTGCYFAGTTASFAMASAISVVANSVDLQISGNRFYHLHTGVLFDSGSASVAAGNAVISANHFVPVERGVVSINNGETFIVVSNNHIAARQRGVQLGNNGSLGSAHSHIKNNLIFKVSYSGSSEDFTGIEIGSDNNAVHANTIINFAGTSTASLGIVIANNSASSGGGPAFNRVTENLCWSLRDTAYWSQSATRDGHFFGNKIEPTGANFAVIEGSRNVFKTVEQRGALLGRGSNQAVGSGTLSAIAWDSVNFDTSGFWTSGQSSRLTIPAGQGIQMIRLTVSVEWQSSSTGSRFVCVKKNGGDAIGLPLDRRAALDNSNASLVSAPIKVGGGDYFEVFVLQNSGGDLNLSAGGCSFSVEVV